MKTSLLSPLSSLRFFSVLLMAAVLAGCATGPATLRTQVTAFNDWSALPAEKSYAFSRTLQLRNALEVQTYEALVREELDKLGFKEASDPAAARILVTLRPSVSAIYWRQYDYWAGPWGYDPWGYRGWGPYRHPYFGRPWGYPYAYVPFDMSRDSTLYRRKLQLEMDLQGTTPLKRLYEATVQNDDWSDSLPQAMPYLVRALFSDFPGNNGETRKVDVVVDEKQ